MSYFVNKEQGPPLQEVYPGILGRLIHTKLTTVADFSIADGTVLPTHHHPHEQTSTVLSGKFFFVVGEEEKILEAGDVAVIPSNVPHSGKALTDCRIIDVFSPVREDYRI